MKCLRCGKETKKENYFLCGDCFKLIQQSAENEKCICCEGDGDEYLCADCFDKIIKYKTCLYCDNELNQFNTKKVNSLYLCIDCANKLESQKNYDNEKIKENSEKITFKNNQDTNHKIKTKFGFYTISKSEKIIADWFYDHKINVEYEKEIKIKDIKLRPDFYIKEFNLILEHFGMESIDYLKKCLDKIKLYSQSKYNFMFTTEEDINNIDEILEEKILK